LGEVTKSALQKWQTVRGIPGTGFFGELSRAVFAIQNPMKEESYEEVTAEHGEGNQETTAHGHEPLDVSKWPLIPSVTITLHPDSMSGYNLEIKPVNFRFAPEHVNGAVLPNEGHVHIMVGDVKLARGYGSWFHIPKDVFKGAGPHEVVVTLNANDHSDLVYNGVRVEARQTVTTN
jgi:hypothetical protein